MLIALKFKLAVMAGILAAPVVMQALAPRTAVDPDLAELPPADFSYRIAGDFSHGGRPVEAPRLVARLSSKLAIMKHQVTVAEYRRCIDAGACPAIGVAGARADTPMVGVNWHDAMAYAAWISAATGLTYRLPTDREWSFAAGDGLRDEAAPLIDPSDPAQAWIARYEAEAARAGAIVLAPQPVGAFGRNSNGLLDVGGNVWEWTASCFVRATLDGETMQVTNTNCGVRVVEGAHRTYMTDFIRDPRTGGCAAGVPPANLGFRLVVERRWPLVSAIVDRLGSILPST
jgi:formylglycine-generating enzyme required for sulfatase activity